MDDPVPGVRAAKVTANLGTAVRAAAHFAVCAAAFFWSERGALWLALKRRSRRPKKLPPARGVLFQIATLGPTHAFLPDALAHRIISRRHTAVGQLIFKA